MQHVKPVRIRSKALTDSARGKECTLRLDGCNYDRETTVFAHFRQKNSGLGTKPPDFIGAYACSSCHAEQERGRVAWTDMFRALVDTQTIMAREGLLQVKGYKP